MTGTFQSDTGGTSIPMLSHNERKVGLGLGGKHTCGGEPRVIDKSYVIISFPLG